MHDLARVGKSSFKFTSTMIRQQHIAHCGRHGGWQSSHLAAVPPPVGQGEVVAALLGVEDWARPDRAPSPGQGHGDLAVLVRQVAARQPAPDAGVPVHDNNRARAGAHDEVWAQNSHRIGQQRWRIDLPGLASRPGRERPDQTGAADLQTSRGVHRVDCIPG